MRLFTYITALRHTINDLIQGDIKTQTKEAKAKEAGDYIKRKGMFHSFLSD